ERLNSFSAAFLAQRQSGGLPSTGIIAQRFRRMKTLQKFSSVHAPVHNHFNQERHLVDRQTCKLRRSAALVEWQIVMA
ncbi:MAG: hypothetical protein ABIO43_02705, partial [Sphingomicrobium sp.]